LVLASTGAQANGLVVPAEERLPQWAPCLAERQAFLDDPSRPRIESYRLLLEDAHDEALLEYYRPLLAKARAAGLATDENVGVLLRRNFADAAELACLTNGRVPPADGGSYSLEHYRRGMLLISLDIEELKTALLFFEPPTPKEMK
jgi:hypothetical protein